MLLLEPLGFNIVSIRCVIFACLSIGLLCSSMLSDASSEPSLAGISWSSYDVVNSLKGSCKIFYSLRLLLILFPSGSSLCKHLS